MALSKKGDVLGPETVVSGEPKSTFNVNDFRNNLSHGLGEPTLFEFGLLYVPEIISNIFKIPTEEKSLLSNINNIAEKGLSIAKNFLPQAYGVSAYLNQGMSTYNNLFGQSPKQSIMDLRFRVSRTSVPDRMLETYTSKYYGIQYTNPRDIAPNFLTINVISSENYWEHWFFLYGCPILWIMGMNTPHMMLIIMIILKPMGLLIFITQKGLQLTKQKS